MRTPHDSSHNTAPGPQPASKAAPKAAARAETHAGRRASTHPAGRESFQKRKSELIKVSELMPSGQTLKLDHEGEIYTLRVTRNRKLILTK